MADREAIEHTIHVWYEFVKRALLSKSSCKTKTFDLRGKRIKHEYLFDREEKCLMKSLVQNKLSSNFIKHEFVIKQQFDDTRGKPVKYCQTRCFMKYLTGFPRP